MRKRNPKTLFVLAICLILFLSLTKGIVEGVRGFSSVLFAPFWETMAEMKGKTSESLLDERLQKLSLENKLQQEEIRRLQRLLLHELAMLRKAPALQQTPSLIDHKRHIEALRQTFEFQIDALPAQVIYRSPESWNSSFWINVGSENNEKLKRLVVAKDSPVVVGESLVGVVDFVGKKQSRIRLLTDSGVTPSVRVAREEAGDRTLAEALERVAVGIEIHPNWLSDEANRDIFKHLLDQCRRNCRWTPGAEQYLAKGELHGSGSPLWRLPGSLLKGKGFNYDFSDDEGPARDLRTGKPYEGHGQETALLKLGDLLITTGMDGVFPPGLLVAEVVHIYPLKEGDYFYELEAKPTAGSLEDLTDVFVLPPYSESNYF